jgi:SAM-dependent methyltransferase
MTSGFRDHFAFASSSYASFRPEYPDELFSWLGALTPGRARAWDCGTGTGQAAKGLARYFDEVIATDASLSQLASAAHTDRVHYAAMSAEAAALGAHAVDLVTAAQALHWFDVPRFYSEVHRVLKPQGVVAVWSYGLLGVDPTTDAVLHELYRETLGDYWPRERALVDSGYASIALPYPEVPAPEVQMEAIWTPRELEGYLATWSAVGRYRKASGRDPIPEAMRRIEAAWPVAERRRVGWPLLVRAARKNV